jgi:hypothetical protein
MCRTYGAGAFLFRRAQRLHAGLTCGAPTALPFVKRLWVNFDGIREKPKAWPPASCGDVVQPVTAVSLLLKFYLCSQTGV